MQWKYEMVFADDLNMTLRLQDTTGCHGQPSDYYICIITRDDLLTPWAVLAPVALLTVSLFSMWAWCLVEAGWEAGAGAATSPLFSWSWNEGEGRHDKAGTKQNNKLIESNVSITLWPLLLRTWLCLPAFRLPGTLVVAAPAVLLLPGTLGLDTSCKYEGLIWLCDVNPILTGICLL